MYKFGKGIKAAWAHSGFAHSQNKEVGVWQLRYLKLTWSQLSYYRKREVRHSLAKGFESLLPYPQLVFNRTVNRLAIFQSQISLKPSWATTKEGKIVYL